MKISLKEVKAGYPPEKRQSDTLWAKMVIRRFSIYLAWLAIRLNISAFTVSIISLLFPMIAMIFWLSSMPLVAIILLMAWLLLDCIDGNVARAMGGTKMGSFVDAASGYAMIGFSFFGLGAYLDITYPDVFSSQFAVFTLLGATISILNLLARLYFQKYLNVLNNSNSAMDGGVGNDKGFLKFVDKNVGIGGFFTPLLLIAYYVEMLIPVLILYGIYTLVYFTGITGKLMLRSRK